MGKIKYLSPEVITHIAAGEVIDRPAAVVKELIENALDAEASQITVTLEEGGVRKIIVTDNGFGMDQTDLELCFKAHTTSKLSTVTDLQSLSSLGFRGEALASIAAVSQLTIKSRPATEVIGTGLKIQYSHVQAMAPVGMASGTQVIVEDLFLNMPARRQFLKTSAAEIRAIIRLITHLALAYPATGFSVTHNGTPLLDFSNQHTFSDRVRVILGEDMATSLVPVQHSQENMNISGFISKPQQARTSSSYQYLVVNNRIVRQPGVSQIIKEAYGTLLPPRLQPVFVINIQLPSRHVDPNIHPRKEQVDIQGEATLKTVLRQLVKNVLHQQDLTYQYHSTLAHEAQLFNDAGADPALSGVLRDATDPWDVRRTQIDLHSDIAQVHKLYLIVQTNKGMLIIDQHAAHERILYEQFKATFEQMSHNDTPYLLPEPHLLTLPVADLPVLEEHRTIFTALGFDIEPFGNTTYKITAVPALFKSHDIGALVTGVLDDLRHKVGTINLEKAAHKTLAYLACRTAIKAGDTLSPLERHELIKKLNQTPGQYTCPHGRPVQVEVDLNTLHHMFKRIS